MLIDVNEAVDERAELQVLDAILSSESSGEYQAVFDSGIAKEDFSDDSYAWVWVTMRQSFYSANWEQLPWSFYERLESASRMPACKFWDKRVLNRVARLSLESPPQERREAGGGYKYTVGSNHWWGTWIEVFNKRDSVYGVPVAEEVEKYRLRLYRKRKLRGLQRIAAQMLKRTSDGVEAATADGMELFILGQLERFREELE